MTDAIALGEKLLSLLEESARTTTYKPALLLALIDRVPEYGEGERIPVRALAERVIELYWPQTPAYPTTGDVLRQSQTSGGRAAIVQAILAFRAQHAPAARALPPAVRREQGWEQLLARVEETLAEWPIPRLQRPYEPFLYNFDWGWTEAGGWSVRAYRSGSRAIRLHPGVGDALTALGPLLRPFITRWWTDKAAQLNPEVEAARSVLEFEDFLFGRDRVALERIAEGSPRSSARRVLLLPHQRWPNPRDRSLHPVGLLRRRRPRQPCRRLPPLQQQQACDPRRSRTPPASPPTQPRLEPGSQRNLDRAPLAT